ncbi:subtilisin family serine protease [Labrenzia sp. EL_142]|nr:subtilisin family serine protease [Labrenzia sp. EL_142]
MKIGLKMLLGIVLLGAGSVPTVGQESLDSELSQLLNKSLKNKNTAAEVVKPNNELSELLSEIDRNSEILANTNSQHGAVNEIVKAIETRNPESVARFSIQIDPMITRKEAENSLQRYGLVPLEASEYFGVISVGKLLGTSDTTPDTAAVGLSSSEVLDILQNEPNFLSVIEEPVWAPMEFFAPELSLGPMPFGEDDALALRHATVSQNSFDWGLENIGVATTWDQPLAQQGVSVGVLDIGFNFHQDLPLWGLANSAPVKDHGNHVAGILCAKHNGRGVNGVLPTCLVVPRTPIYSGLASYEGVRANTMVAVLNAFEEIIENRDDIKAINVSLGYNWRKKVGRIELNDDEKQHIADTASQLLGLYKLAKERDIFIVTAAGNDSFQLDQKMNAVWSSPMNFASRVFCTDLDLCNGVIVEAHDAMEKHADFSNIGGDLSCPGVDILSTVAHDIHERASSTDYAFMSGTSMASPYCAGGLVLTSLVRPNYSAPEIITCAKEAARSVEGAFSAPAFDMLATLEHCPRRNN